MSVQSEITRITTAVASAYDAVDDIGGTLPASETVGNLASAISSIANSVTESYTNVSSVSSKTKVLHGSSFYQKIVPDDGYLISSVTVTMGGVDITSQVFSGDTGSSGGGTTPTGTLSIVQNGTVDVTNYASASVSVPNTYSSSDEGKVVDGGALVAQTSDTVTANGTYDTTTVSSLTVNVSSGGGSSKAVQVYSGYDEVNATAYTATDVSVTVAKSGTYKCSWMGLRNTTSGTSGSQLYVNGSAAGSAHTSGWIRSYGCYFTDTLTLNAGDVLTVYARARASNYYMVVGNLIIEEQ